VKTSFRKYCSLKSAVVILLLLSFNLVSFGRDINDCCKKQTVEKKSCCTKKVEKTCSSHETGKKSCGGNNGKNDCSKCNLDKNGTKHEGTVNETKNINTEIKISVIEFVSENIINQITKSYFLDKYPPGIKSKLYINISSLLI
jgi:hypothetical protein